MGSCARPRTKSESLAQLRLTSVRGIAALFVLAFVVSCANNSDDSANPWSADFEAALSQATSAFERDVLEDHEVTRLEYEEAVSRLVSCMSNEGHEVTPVLNAAGYYAYEVPGSDPLIDEAFDRCSRGSTYLVEAFFVDVTINPQNLDLDELIVDCLRDLDMVGPEFTVDDYRATYQLFSMGPDGEIAVDATAADPPYDTDDPRLAACQMNPSAPPDLSGN